nr:hypothetical protein [Prolixibacteraceae bacterium]
MVRFRCNYWFLLLLFITACRSDKMTLLVDEWDYFCTTETSNESGMFLLDSLNPSIRFRNIEARTMEEAFSGTYSLKLDSGHRYGFTITMRDLKRDEYFRISAWKKSQNASVLLIASGDDFYQFGGEVTEQNDKGWEKLEMEIFVPPTALDEMILYALFKEGDSAYVDDFRIERRTEKKYPEFDTGQTFKLFYDQTAEAQLQAKRTEAFQNGVLLAEDEDFVSAIIFSDDDFYESKIRLKGDWLDHLQGDKWSFRVNLKNGYAWRNMTTFSIQTPAARNFQHEWVLHEMLFAEDLLTTRYGFIPLSINGKSKGIYAWEEHFDKQLLESNKRREGPIVRFDESLFWEINRMNSSEEHVYRYPFFEGTVITPFNSGSVLGDPLLSKQFAEARSLLHQIQFRQNPVSEMYDVKKLAGFFAVNLLNKAYHGLAWHNIRFYYNPVLCRLEPITFDGGYEEWMESDDKKFAGDLWELINNEKTVESSIQIEPLKDRRFLEELRKYWQKLSDSSYIDAFFSSIDQQLRTDEALIRKEFPGYSYSPAHILQKAQSFRSLWPDMEKRINSESYGKDAATIHYRRRPLNNEYNENLMKYLVHAYVSPMDPGNAFRLELENFFGDSVQVVAIRKNTDLTDTKPNEPFVVAPFSDEDPIQSISIPFKPDEVIVRVPAQNKSFTLAPYPWKAPEALSSRQKIERSLSFPQNRFYTCNGKDIIFEGEKKVDQHIIIPEGYFVRFSKGCRIDLTDSATFVSYSPIYIEGTATAPVVIRSSDRSARGFNILQATHQSKVQHAVFEGISNLSFDGWFTPAAVCFYESDVDMNHVTFKNNSGCDDALNIVRSHFRVDRCRFEGIGVGIFNS